MSSDPIALTETREVQLHGKTYLLQVLPTRYEPIPESGDGNTVCAICGEVTDQGHTADQCAEIIQDGIAAAYDETVDYLSTENATLSQQNSYLQHRITVLNELIDDILEHEDQT
jgi:hypothetical protein